MKKTTGFSTLAIIFWSIIGYALLMTLFTVPALLLDGWALLKLYGWFILPVFRNAPTISLGQFIGISIFVGFLTRSYVDAKGREGTEALVHALSWSYLAPLLIVFVGWIVYLIIT